MTDSLLADTDIEEGVSKAYVHAVAVSAGYVTALKDFDRDGVDVTIEAGSVFRPKIDVQLKSTINLPLVDGKFSLPLKARNYNLLTIKTQTPRLLVVMHLPKEKLEWINMHPEQLVLRNCAYWHVLEGMAETTNSTSVTVHVPQENRFNKDTLVELMEKSRSGSLL
ncbi:UNVERIFIED_ORG: hypothetical protein GGI63_004018 [Rhizobium esperanzae]|nr:hypothetical protein RHECNPAF_209007 [Rhizobium etli CNPAF512]